MKSLPHLTAMLMLFIFTGIKGQVVNIESARMQSDTTGLMGEINSNFSLTKNNNEVFSVDLNTHLQYKSKKDLYLFIASYGFLKAAASDLINNTFLHFRYNRKLNKSLRWEAFIQLQKNAVNKIDIRFLIGTGPRFKIVDKKSMKLYLASLVMHEYQKDKTEPVVTQRDIRSSSYISITLKPLTNLEIASTTFYQPLINSIADYRVLNQAGIKIKAGQHFGLSLYWNYLFDSRPVPGIPKVNYNLSSGLGYEF